mmetsp:Transcript_37914/g.109050  ORF Transcript_37914/g.109050 Transcript_37914/m.109050 type:complete len:279 (-) Transcript_37914:95-931(-)
MSLRPASRCCCRLSLLRGVQLIALYAILVGSWSILTLLTGDVTDGGDSTSPEPLQSVAFLETAFHTVAFFIGLKSLKGVAFRDPWRLRILLIYFISEVIVQGVAFTVRWMEVCSDWRGLHLLHRLMTVLPCPWRRVVLASIFVAESGLSLYLAYMVWSLIVRIEFGDIGAFRLRFAAAELADRGATISDPWLFLSEVGAAAAAGGGGTLPIIGAGLMAGGLTGGGVAGGGGAEGSRGTGVPPPFSGQPRRLELAPETEAPEAPPPPPEPFRGRAQRLD